MVGIIKRKSKEHNEQTKFIMFVRTFHPEIMCWSIPNGSGTTAANRMRLVHEGLLAGMPDVMLMTPGPRVLALEFKRPDGKGCLSEAQKGALGRLSGMGCSVGSLNGFEAAKEALADWLSEVSPK